MYPYLIGNECDCEILSEPLNYIIYLKIHILLQACVYTCMCNIFYLVVGLRKMSQTIAVYFLYTWGGGFTENSYKAWTPLST